ncbi:hypothetical protein AB4F11_08770 [Francisella philomiragia]
MSTLTKEIPAYIPSRVKSSDSIEYKYIPKKIFKTWRTSEVSQEMYNAVYTWVDKNPDWEFHFFDDQASVLKQIDIKTKLRQMTVNRELIA